MKKTLIILVFLFSSSVFAKDITNTKWNVVNYDGNTQQTDAHFYYEINFLNDGKCYWELRDYEETVGRDVCTWVQIEHKLFYQLNNFSEYNITLDNNNMFGKGYYNDDSVVKVKGTLVE